MNVRLRLAGVSLIALTVASGATPSFAQTAPPAGPDARAAPPLAEQDDVAEQPGTVIVTARRQNERLLDVPTAATVVDAESIQARGGVTDVQALVAQAPSVRFFNTSSPVNSELSIRGSGTARGTNADPSVGLYRDGLYIGGGALGGRSFSRLDLFDLSRVEVLRGPQGALYGRNAVGGAINILTAKPDPTRVSSFVDLNYEFETEAKQVQAMFNAPLGEHWAIRFGVDVINQDKGFFYNPDNRVYFDQNNTYGLRGQIRYKDSRTDLNLLGEFQDGTTPAVTFQVSIPVGAAGFPTGYVQDPYSYPWNFPPAAGQKVKSTIFTGSHDFDFATLNAAASYRERTSYFQFDSDAIDQAALTALRARGNALTTDPNTTTRTDDQTNSFTGNLYLAGRKQGGFRWLLGGEILRQTSNFTITTGRTPTVANKAIGFSSPARIRYNSEAVYGSVGYDLTERLNANLDLRYTWDSKSFVGNRFDRTTGLQAGGPQFIVDAAQNPRNLAYTGTIGWKAMRDVLVYGRAGSGYRAGAFNTNLGDSRAPKLIPATYGNENSTSYELGVKGNLTRSFYLALAGYYTRVGDVLVQDDNGCAATNPACPVASTPYLINAGKARIEGVELEANWRHQIGPGRLRLSGGVSRQLGRITEGSFAGRLIPQIPKTIGSGGRSTTASLSEARRWY